MIILSDSFKLDRKSKNNNRQGTEQWEFSGSYWDNRKGGFKNANVEELW